MMAKIFGMIFALLLCVGAVSAQDKNRDDIAINQNETPMSVPRKPALTDGIQYLSANGNDANDGLSQGSAKLTWDAACQALPGGTASPPTCGSGRIKVLKTASASTTATCGRWVMASTDPNYASPPSCWERYSGPLVTECDSGGAFGPHGASAACVITGGSTSVVNDPGLWISGSGHGFEDDHIAVSNYLLTPIKLGICSNLDRTGTCGTQSVWLNGTVSNFGNCALGGGPGIDIGSNSFWIYIDHPAVSGCGRESYTFSSLTRVGATAVVTGITTTTNDLVVGKYVTINVPNDPSFNGSFKVTSVSGTPQTTVTWTQAGPDASASSGYMFWEKSAAIAVDPTGGGGSGLIFINHPAFSNGGIWLGGNASATITNASMEGNEVGPTPPELMIPNLSLLNIVKVSHMETADESNPTIPAIEVDGACLSHDNVIAEQVGSVVGCATVIGIPLNSYQSQVKSPTRLNQAGFQGGHVYGQTDAAARLFGPSAVRYANIVQEFDPSTWTVDLGSGTITTGISAPDGTSNAGQAVGNGRSAYIKFYQHSQTISVGGTFAYAVWARSQTANGFVGGLGPLQFSFNSHGGGAGDACTSDGITNPWPEFEGDGQWVRVWGICKVSANPTTASVTLYGVVDGTHTIQFYAPTLVYIPAGTLSDNEAWALASNLSVYPPSCVVGTVCGLNAPFVLSGVPRIVYNAPSPSTSGNISAVTIVSRTSAEHDYLDAWTVSLTASGSGCVGKTTVDIEGIFTDPEAKSPTTENLGTVTLAASGDGKVGFVSSGMDNILAKSETAVRFATANYTAGFGCKTNPTYIVTHTLEQLW